MEYIDNRTESDVVAEFAHRVKVDGRLAIKLEVMLPSRHHRSGKFRADALIIKPTGEIVCALEFKRPGKKVGARTRQRSAYADLPYPHFYVIGMNGIKRILPLVYVAAGFDLLKEPVNCFGKSAVSRRGRVKPSAVLCNDCNMGKSNDDFTDFRPKQEVDDQEELEIMMELNKRI